MYLSSLERSANFKKLVFLKNVAIKQHIAILQEFRNICYEMQKLLRKVCIYIQNVYYAGNIFISRNIFIVLEKYLSIL